MKLLHYHTLDLNFQGIPNNIASYIFPYQNEAGKTKWVMIETGPHSCTKTMLAELEKHNLSPYDIDKVLITHIHLDHSGGAWVLAEAGATIYAHPLGAPHLISPEKLYESAKRIYTDKMEVLWGEVKPIPENQVIAVPDRMHFTLPTTGSTESKTSNMPKEYLVTAHHTPGHAAHHIAWQVNEVLFTGDVCGVQVMKDTIEIPAPPPEFQLEEWKQSLKIIRKLVETRQVNEFALTHFGNIKNHEAEPHRLIHFLDKLEDRLNLVVAWFRGQLMNGRTMDERELLTREFIDFLTTGYRSIGLNDTEINAIKTITPPEMSVTGILRYLKKYEQFS